MKTTSEILYKAIFLDRDGVINQEMGTYVYTWENFKFESGIFDFCRKATSLGYKLIVITNQGGIAKGIYTREQTEHLHTKMQSMFSAEGCSLTGIYYSPFHKDISKNIMSKPSDWMITRACSIHKIDPQQSWMIGDKPRDIAAGLRAGCRTVGIGAEVSPILADRWFDSMASAAQHFFE